MNVVSFYRFADLADPPELKAGLEVECARGGLLGTILVAPEGVNGTLAGDAEAVRAVLSWLETALGLEPALDGHWTEASEAPFRRLRVRLKKEIVALGRPDIRPDKKTGQYVGVEEWNRLISDPETLVIDTRNSYEYEVGTFRNAVDPVTDSFREFPAYAKELAEENPNRRLAMFCTGGIRCEKATALMLELGFDEVYHLQGGILRYLEEVGDEDNLWQGECFVFDTRVAVDRDRAEGGYVQCHACRRPLSAEDIASPDYREGVSCPKCIGSHDPEKLAGLEERRKQVRLARQRGDEHVGARLE
jgi:UPF0176 protein